ncbi:MAG: hypothetical protein IPM82_29570 [Saprospiraceae bacterium]|nr:hypothetical protein [Saprospiraceae bacterium]
MTLVTRSLLFATAFLFCSHLLGQTRYYVNAAATGGNDGSSWADAFIDLQAAMAASQGGDEVCVATGTYYPTATTDRNISFVLKNGVKLYGGFAGTEALLNERDWVVNETILSGDIGAPGDSTDNSYNVVYGQDVTFTCSINGFIIERGMADNQDPLEPSYSRKKSGGGIHLLSNVISTHPNIENCVFRNNIAAYAGGAMLLRANSNKNINPKVAFCKFVNNHSFDGGGAIYVIGGSFQGTLPFGFSHCEFESNSSSEIGSAIYYFDSFGSVPLSILDCNFSNNLGHNGTIAYRDFNDSQESIRIYGCCFNNNIAPQGSCLFAQYASQQTDGIAFSNCNFDNNIGSCLFLDVGTTAEDGVALDGCIFNENQTTSAIRYLGSNGSMKISNTQFKKNNSSSGLINTGSFLKIENCVFEKNNGIGNSGRVITMYDGIIKNSLFSSNNYKLDGDEIYCAGNLQVYNSTFVDNLATADSSHMFILNDSHFENTIIIKNNLLFPNKLFNAYGNLTIQNSLLSSPDCSSLPITCGLGNLFGIDPMFADTAAGDFTLLPSSPAINAGDNAIVDSLGIITDLAGNTRIRGGIVDMGAYESTAGNIIYVNLNVQGGNQDGTSWPDAFSDLQDALAVAAYGDEIWVAQGTYYPTSGTDRNIYFDLKNGILLFGGFTGVETALFERDWQVNQTILSGDIGGVGDVSDNAYTVVYMADVDSSTVLDGFTIVDGNANSNSANEPVTARSKSGGGVYITSNIMGFVTAPRIMNCAFVANNSVWNGGAVIVYNKENFIVNPYFTSCKFSSNTSRFGGAINVYGGNNEDDLVFSNCLFEGNFARNGGAVHYYNLYGTHQLVLDSCIFDVNFADDSGGAYFQEVTNPETTNLLVSRCKFSYNSALSGGAIASISFVDDSHVIIQKSKFSDNFGFEAASIQGLYDKFYIISTEFTREIGYACMVIQESPVNIYNCVFNKCVVNDDDGNLLVIASGVLLDSFRIINSTFYENDVALGILSISDNINYSIANSVFFGNTLNPYGKVFQSGGPNPFYANIYNCLFDVPDGSYLAVSPITVGPGNLYNLDPQFVDPNNGDFHLLPTSPAINAGDNAIVDSLGITTDLAGNPRIRGGTVDMGAYESAVGNIIHVNLNVQGGNQDGTSWPDAFSDLQDAIAVAAYGKEIWIAQGTYYPTSGSSRNAYFEMKNGVKLYGGFKGVEHTVNERDWQANETILSGDIGVPGDSLDNSYTILYIETADTTTIVDGLVFRHGNANRTNVSASHHGGSGGAIFIKPENSYSYPVIRNCLLSLIMPITMEVRYIFVVLMVKTLSHQNLTIVFLTLIPQELMEELFINMEVAAHFKSKTGLATVILKEIHHHQMEEQFTWNIS